MNEDAAPSRVKRMLPSVSEVLKELTARAPVEPDVAFRAAREVCAEELKRIRDAGGDSVPLEELVQRALVRVSGGRPGMAVPTTVVLPPEPPPPGQLPLVPALGEPAPFAPAPEPIPADEGPIPLEPVPPGPEAAAVDDPFGETAGAMDLRWDRESREPFTEPAAAGPAPFILPAEPESGFTGEPAGVPASRFVAEGETNEGPGDETLSRLSREAESIDLNAVFPRPGAGSAGATEGAVPRPAPEAFEAPFEDDEDTVLTVPRGGRSRTGAGPRLGAILGIAAGLVVLAGIGYLLVGLWMERDATPPPVAVARPRPTPDPVVPATPAAPAAAATGAAPGSASVMPVAEATAAPSSAPAAVPPPATAPAPVVATPPRTAPPVAVVAPAASAPAPTLVRPAPVRQSRDGLVVTRDRAGRPEVWSIHFTSYRDRASAERDLKRVERLAGRPGYVAEVDLGEKGLWYRVMAGEFPSAQEAKSAREELVAKGTPDLGWVYRVVGSE